MLRKIFSLVCALLVFAIMAFPPHAHHWRTGTIEKTSLGYHFLLDPPLIRVNGLARRAPVDLQLLITELGAVTLIWVFMLVALRQRRE